MSVKLKCSWLGFTISFVFRNFSLQWSPVVLGSFNSQFFHSVDFQFLRILFVIYDSYFLLLYLHNYNENSFKTSRYWKSLEWFIRKVFKSEDFFRNRSMAKSLVKVKIVEFSLSSPCKHDLIIWQVLKYWPWANT